MREISAKELRNNLADTLRRVEAGEHLRVTVSGRPVAQLAPIQKRPAMIAWETFLSRDEDWRADSALTNDLAELLPDTTDDAPIL